jgi:hypothetical protein
MQLIFTHHALQRMKQRRVSEEQIVETIELPDEIYPGDGEEETAVRSYGSREVRVVYHEIEPATYLILTVIKPRTTTR